MRILHTGDWHLGRLFHGVHLTEDQAHVLDQVIEIAGSASPDVILISGDVYDRAVPPSEAVSLLNDVITRIVRGLRIPVVMIAGNHDAPERLAFGSGLMRDQGFHVAGPFSGTVQPVVLSDRAGPVRFYPLPYAEPAVMRQKMADPELKDHDAAMRVAVSEIRERHPSDARSVLLAHAFVVGAAETDSERPLSVGGTGAVGASCFGGFDYVALGHLHRPQSVGGDPGTDPSGGAVQYAGSLMKYSFSEAGHEKCIKIVELDDSGKCGVESIVLRPRHDVRCIEGNLDEVLAAGVSDPDREDYISVTLLDRGAIYDVMGKLREVYPNVLELKRTFLTPEAGADAERFDHREHSDLELFKAFFEQTTGENLNPEQTRAFCSIVDDLRRRDREAGS